MFFVLAILSQVLSSYSKFVGLILYGNPLHLGRLIRADHSKSLGKQLWNLSQLKRYAPEWLHLPSTIGLKIKHVPYFPPTAPEN